ncbi:MAG: ATP-binding protein [Candidatus Heimdallarchaeaceae archaeon]
MIIMPLRDTSFYKHVFDNAQDAIFLLDADNKFIECNPITMEMFSCKKEEIIGKTPIDFSPIMQLDGQTSKEKALEKIEGAFKGQPQIFDWIHTRKDGTPFFAQVSLSKVVIDGTSYLLAIVRDITETFLKHELNELFSILIEHDIRNSVVAIDGYISFLEGKIGEKEEYGNLLLKIKSRNKSIIRSIEHFKQFREIFERREVYPVILAEILQEAINLEAEILKQNSVEIVINVDADTTVKGSKFLGILFANLIRNAIEHGKCSKIVISANEMPKSDLVSIRFEDDGVGVKEEVHKQIFLKEYKGSKSNGSGLGLYLVRRTILLLDGDIKAEKSELGGLKLIINLKKHKEID